jgi:hypothetical protein
MREDNSLERVARAARARKRLERLQREVRRELELAERLDRALEDTTKIKSKQLVEVLAQLPQL